MSARRVTRGGMKGLSLVPVSKTQVDRNQGVAIKKLKKKVNGIARALEDTHQWNLGETKTPGITAAINIVSAVAEGDDVTDRFGRETTLTSWRFAFTVSPNASTTSDTCRLILFRYKSKTGGSLPTASDILTTTNNVNSSLNKTNRSNFEVLKDIKLDCSVQNGTKNRVFKIGMKKKKAYYSSSTAASYDAGHLFYLVLFADDTNKATFAYYSSVNFNP